MSCITGEKIYSTEDWCRKLIKRKLKNIFLLLNISANNPKLAGFANSEAQCIVTVFKSGRVSYWTPQWEFDSVRKTWTIYYQEQIWENAPTTLPVFENTKDDFKNVLYDIKKLADKIECELFANIFQSAFEILTEKEKVEIPDWMKDTMPKLDEEKMRMFLAASKADVFGGMGAWNDDPVGMAYEKGEEDNYNQLSNELYNQIRKTVMYVVNN